MNKKVMKYFKFGIKKSQFIHRKGPDMRTLIRLFICCISLSLFSSCSNKQYQYLFQQKGTDTIAVNSTSVQDHYRIKPQDILEIRNLQNDKDIVDLNPSIAGSPSNQITTN